MSEEMRTCLLPGRHFCLPHTFAVAVFAPARHCIRVVCKGGNGFFSNDSNFRFGSGGSVLPPGGSIFCKGSSHASWDCKGLVTKAIGRRGREKGRTSWDEAADSYLSNSGNGGISGDESGKESELAGNFAEKEAVVKGSYSVLKTGLVYGKETFDSSPSEPRWKGLDSREIKKDKGRSRSTGTGSERERKPRFSYDDDEFPSAPIAERAGISQNIDHDWKRVTPYSRFPSNSAKVLDDDPHNQSTVNGRRSERDTKEGRQWQRDDMSTRFGSGGLSTRRQQSWDSSQAIEAKRNNTPNWYSNGTETGREKFRDGDSNGWYKHWGNDWRREPSKALPVEGQAVYGVGPIQSALQASRRNFFCLYVQENLSENLSTGKRKDKQAVRLIEKFVEKMGIPRREVSKHDLNMLVENRPHQGLVLDASPLEMIPVDELEFPSIQGNKTPVWVALDEITDPQNFGAILRSAYFLGAEGVVVCAKNSAPLSGVVSKASAGALEVMEVQYCKNMVKFLERSSQNGWRVVGSSADRSSVPVRELPHGIPTILVLGNEGRGMRTNVKGACSELVHISSMPLQQHEKSSPEVDFCEKELSQSDDNLPEETNYRKDAELECTSGFSAVDSLNVSVAAGILLYELIAHPA